MQQGYLCQYSEQATWLDDALFEFRQEKKHFFFPKRPARPWGPPKLQWVPAFLPGNKAART
jgi:hypothetical protein